MMIAVGVDTHKHQHLAVAVDALGQLLAEITITATLAGYGELLAWLAALGGEIRVGIEGAGIATSSALVVESIMLYFVAKRRLGFHVFIMGGAATPAP